MDCPSWIKWNTTDTTVEEGNTYLSIGTDNGKASTYQSPTVEANKTYRFQVQGKSYKSGDRTVYELFI